jgi:hypothetical protein
LGIPCQRCQAATHWGSKKRKSSSTDSDSEDSDVAVQLHEKRQRQKALLKSLQDDCDSENLKVFRRQITEQKSKNEKQLTELAKVRNSYQVFYISTEM